MNKSKKMPIKPRRGMLLANAISELDIVSFNGRPKLVEIRWDLNIKIKDIFGEISPKIHQ
jgi:hypothetical protein